MENNGITQRDIIREVNSTTKKHRQRKQQSNQKNSLPNKKHPLLKKELISILPPILKEGVNRLVDENDKLVFLLSAIGVLSGVMPNVSGYYDGKRLAPNLFVFIIGGYGSGKGAMTYAKNLIKSIEDEIQEENEQDLAAWEKLPRKEKAHEPRPIPKGIIIPANASASVFLQMLNDNKGKGILFETEGDTLAQTLTTDHGNYSDILRKAYHHEFTAMARRTNNERIVMKEPRLSVVLTGTPNQFKRLIPNTENGLFSRFMYLTIEAEKGFRNVFNPMKATYESAFNKLGETVYKLHHLLRAREEDLTFQFTESQEKEFWKHYDKEKPNFIGNTGDDAAGVFHRLALINFRLAMLFSVLSHYKSNKKFPDKIRCEISDYKAAFKITKVLFYECKTVYFDLPEQQDTNLDITDEAPEIVRIKELSKEGNSIREIEKLTGISRSRVGRIVQKLNK